MSEKNVAGSPDWTDPDDAPELTPEMLANAEVFHGETFVRRGPGRPVAATRKEAVNVRLDADVLAALRAGGPGWQTRLNAVLRATLIDGNRSAETAVEVVDCMVFSRTIAVGADARNTTSES